MALKDLIKNVKQQGQVNLIKDLDFYLQKKANKPPEPSRLTYLHPSVLSGCLRVSVYERLGVPQKTTFIDGRMQRIFDNGNRFHERMIDYYLHMNILLGAEVPFRIEEPYRISGKADGKLLVDGRVLVLELKSINDRGFSLLVEPKPQHVRQGQIYVQGLDAQGLVLQYENKNTQEVREFYLDRDRAVIEEMLDRALMVWAHLRDGRLPPRDCRTISDGRWCAFQDTCFNDLFDCGPYFEEYQKSTDGTQ